MPRQLLTGRERELIAGYVDSHSDVAMSTHLRSIFWRLRRLSLNQMRVDIELIQLALAKYEEAHE